MTLNDAVTISTTFSDRNDFSLSDKFVFVIIEIKVDSLFRRSKWNWIVQHYEYAISLISDREDQSNISNCDVQFANYCIVNDILFLSYAKYCKNN